VPSAGGAHSLVLVAGDEGQNVVWSWGDNAFGQLGIPVSSPSASRPAATVPVRAADQVAAGGDHSLALAGSEVWVWGRNSEGQLGLGNTNSPVATPTQVEALGSVDIESIDAGENFSVARSETGTVYTWGDNAYGQLGDPAAGSAEDLPRAVPGLAGVDGMAAGGDFVFAWRTTNGGQQEVWSWGRNNVGQLATGGFGEPQAAPQPVTALPELGTVMDIQAGQAHALAQIATADGAVRVYAWGDNFNGQLGTEEVFYSVTPRLVNGLPADVDTIAAGDNHNLVLSKAGRLYGWGDNTSMQLGVAGADQVLTPREIPLPAGTAVIAIAAGADSSFAWTNTGEVLVWGALAGAAVGGPIQPVADFPATLILSANPGAGGAVNILQGQPIFGEQITINAVPAEGYRLDSWSGAAVDEGLVVGSPAENPVTFVIDRDTTLQANFVTGAPGGAFTLTTSVRGGGSIRREPDAATYPSGTRVTVTATPDAHQHFVVWEGSGAALLSDPNDPVASFALTRNVELIAVFAPNVYTLTLEVRGEGTTDPEPGAYEFEPGAGQTVTAIPDPNAQFIRWAGTAVEQGKVADPTRPTATVEMDADYTLIARFTGAPFEIADPNLRNAIARQLGVAEPTEADMARLTKLVLPDAGVTDLTGLEAAVNLDALALQRNQIRDIGPLTELPALRALSLEGNPLSDTAFHDISRLTNLVELNLRNTNDTITDIPAAWPANLQRLRILDLRGNANLGLNDRNVQEMKRLVESRGGTLAVD